MLSPGISQENLFVRRSTLGWKKISLNYVEFKLMGTHLIGNIQ